MAGPPTIAPYPSFMNLHNLRRHIQQALMRVSCPQSNILGWAGLIMSRVMYGLLRTSPFCIPTDPGPLAIYYPARIPIVDTQRDPVLDGLGLPTYQAQPTTNRVEQATINVRFKHAKNIGSPMRIYNVQSSTASTNSKHIMPCITLRLQKRPVRYHSPT
jgi:hypothetical protein